MWALKMILLWVVTWSCPLPDSHMVIKLCHASLILLYIDLTVEIMLWLSQRFCHECVRLNKLVWCNIFIPVCLIFGAVWYHCSEWLTVWFSTVTHHPFSLPFSLSFSAEECFLDSDLSFLVPIAVGVALSFLIVLVLISYLIGRRKSRTGYQSV